MISLSLPNSAEKFYVNPAGFLIGPLALQPTSSDNITFRSNLDFIKQGDEYYHEKDVEHMQVQGQVQYVPALADIVSAPTTTYPQRIAFKAKTWDGKAYTLYSDFGLASNGAFHTRTTSTQRNVVRLVLDSPYSFVQYEWIGSNRSPGSSNSVTIWKSVFTFTSSTASSVNYKLVQQVKKGTMPSGFLKVWEDLTSDKFDELWSLLGSSYYSNTTSTRAYTIYQGTTAPSFSVQSLKEYVDTFIVPQLQAGNSPEDEHYGILAMEASEKVNANQTNMIAFLRDLRRPLDMVPKLKNLLSLKTHSSNYLAMNYGVLPTISDLKEIIGAFKKVLPYMDMNGFTTYNAYRSNTLNTDNYSSLLEQRIKIAIEDEDSDLARLSAKVESTGFALTLENIWDLIPYSFVLDWFIDVGGFLERCDSRMRLMRLNIRYATHSRKETRTINLVPSQTFPCTGNLKLVLYSRWTTGHSPEPPLFFRNTPTVSRHWLEASALTIQRVKQIK